MPETYLDAASTIPLHPRARAALLAAVDEFGDPSRLYARGIPEMIVHGHPGERLPQLVAFSVQRGGVRGTPGGSPVNRERP